MNLQGLGTSLLKILKKAAENPLTRNPNTVQIPQQSEHLLRRPRKLCRRGRGSASSSCRASRCAATTPPPTSYIPLAYHHTHLHAHCSMCGCVRAAPTAIISGSIAAQLRPTSPCHCCRQQRAGCKASTGGEWRSQGMAGVQGERQKNESSACLCKRKILAPTHSGFPSC
jgi:hypothetical protein